MNEMRERLMQLIHDAHMAIIFPNDQETVDKFNEILAKEQ